MFKDYHAPTDPPKWPKWPIRPGHQLPPLPLAMRQETCAKAIGVCGKTLRNLAKRGEIPFAKIGSVTVYPTAAILRWLEEITENPPVKRPEHAEGGDA